MRANIIAAGRSIGAAATMLATLAWAPGALADLVGQPTSGAIDFQPAASKIRADQIAFHNHILLPIIGFISLLVIGLVLVCVVRFNHRVHPVPERWSHNTPIEVLWTIGPVLLLMFIAIFSFRLLYEEHDMPKPYMTVKVTARQWNWDYAYPDQKIPAATSIVLTDDEDKAQGLPTMLGATNPMIVPVGKVIRVEVTAEDVIHSFSVPAFGVKVDAVPGRLNDTWFLANRTGTFYGRCSQLCGIDHAFMPIMVKVVSQGDFDAWVASKQPKAAPSATPAAPTKTATAQRLAAAAPRAS